MLHGKEVEKCWHSWREPDSSEIPSVTPYFWWCPKRWTRSQCCNCHATMGNWKRCSSTWKSTGTQGGSMIAAKFQGVPPYSWHRPIYWTQNQCCNCDATMENWKIHSRTWKTAVTQAWSMVDLKFHITLVAWCLFPLCPFNSPWNMGVAFGILHLSYSQPELQHFSMCRSTLSS